MSDLSAVCALCAADITAVFTAPPRPTQTISGDVFVAGSCFVADEITFMGMGKLIFSPDVDRPNCAVVCRKLIVNGGSEPINLTPCSSGDPGTRYNNTNVITWRGRLTSAAAGSALPAAAAGAAPGATGSNGVQGNIGNAGASLPMLRQGAPATLTIIALEVDISAGNNIVIDWAGQDGGNGGPGQNGGDGAKGTTGGNGHDASWPSSGCSTATGNGGTGGDGGQGGQGGNGGPGGNSGQIIIISTSQNLTGVFTDTGRVTFVTQSSGGNGGPGGHGGGAGAGGNPGIPSSSCGAASKGDPGNSFIGVTAPDGASGSPGNSLAPRFDVVDTSGPCSSVVPIPLQLPAAVPLQTFVRCFSGSGSGSVSILGQYLDQIASVSASLAGVTATIKASSTDTELDLSIAIAANSGVGPCDLIFAYTFPPGMTQTLAGAIAVEAFQATAIATTPPTAPPSGAQGATVNVTITGTGFLAVGGSFSVSVSGGLGDVNAINPTVVNDTTVTCQFVITPNAQKTTRDLTIQGGPALSQCTYTLPQCFTVT